MKDISTLNQESEALADELLEDVYKYISVYVHVKNVRTIIKTAYLRGAGSMLKEEINDSKNAIRNATTDL